MRTLVNIISLIVVSIALVSCYESKDLTVPKTEILAVYMHKPNSFSVAELKVVNGVEHVQIHSPYSRIQTVRHIVVRDVPENESMWYACYGKYNTFSGSLSDDTRCEIHIRNINDVNTGGWDEGKFGSGTTTRIQ